jgi:hypothetical protein
VLLLQSCQALDVLSTWANAEKAHEKYKEPGIRQLHYNP